LTPGTVFINRNPSSPERVWIVVAADAAQLVAFPLKRLHGDGRDDDTCILRSAHPDAKGEWVVSYEERRPISLEKIESMTQRGLVDIRESLSEEQVGKIREGAERSDFTPGKLQRFIADTPIPTKP
jgi:hypothetical protein